MFWLPFVVDISALDVAYLLLCCAKVFFLCNGVGDLFPEELFLGVECVFVEMYSFFEVRGVEWLCLFFDLLKLLVLSLERGKGWLFVERACCDLV